MRGAELTQMMLAYVGQAPMQWTSVRLSDVLDNTLPLLYSILPKTTSIQVSARSVDPLVYADEKLLGQVVVNLAE